MLPQSHGGMELMKNLLAACELNSALDSILRCALLIAQRFEGHVEGISLSPDLIPVMAFEAPMSWSPNDDAAQKEIDGEVSRRFTEFMSANDVPASKGLDERVSWTFVENGSQGRAAIASYAQLFDVTVIGRPGKNQEDPRLATAETLLFESGRPVLLAPPVPPTTLGEQIIVAWNQSMESARAVALAMPLLMRAKKVFVLTIAAHNVEGPSAEQMASMLETRGIPVEVVHRQGAKRAAGIAYLEDSASLGGDLMVKGAYTQNRLRRMIFGGATAHILTKAQMPVFMVN
jgi:nucleotide-binding universal stress UspA family protein